MLFEYALHFGDLCGIMHLTKVESELGNNQTQGDGSKHRGTVLLCKKEHDRTVPLCCLCSVPLCSRFVFSPDLDKTRIVAQSQGLFLDIET